ncbi:MAG: monovalent cation/H+ antiporter subunit A, partial [Cobetia marina]
MTLLLIVLLPLLGALVPLMARNLPRARLAWLTAVAPAIALGIAVFHLGDVFSGMVPQFHLPWIAELGLNLSLRFDGLSGLFVLLILGIGLLIILYSRYYLSGEDSLARLYSFLMLFMTAMLG